MKIYFSDDSPLVEEEIIEKLWRTGVTVEQDGCFYALEFITQDRIAINHRSAKEAGEHFVMFEPTIVVDSVDKQTIISTACDIVKDGYLKYFPLVNFHKYENWLPELTSIENWKLVYSED